MCRVSGWLSKDVRAIAYALAAKPSTVATKDARDVLAALDFVLA